MVRSFFYRSAPCASAGVLRQQLSMDFGVGQDGSIGDHPGGTGATHHDGATPATPVKLEVGTLPASPDDDAPAATGRDGEALPFPSDADDGEARFGMDDGRPLEETSGADDGLPSFSPDDVAPESPAGLMTGSSKEGLLPPGRRRDAFDRRRTVSLLLR